MRLCGTYIWADTWKDVQSALNHAQKMSDPNNGEKGLLACLIVYVWVERSEWATGCVMWWRETQRGDETAQWNSWSKFGWQVRESSRGLVGYSLCMHSPSVQFLDWSTMPSQSFPPFLGAGALHSLLLQWVHSVPQVDHLLHSVHRPSTTTHTNRTYEGWVNGIANGMNKTRITRAGERMCDSRWRETHEKVEWNMQTP